MAETEADVLVEAPIHDVYNQWTQFENFPAFMEGVKEVQQLDDRTLRWRADIGGEEVEWTAVITAQEPDRLITWKSTSGTPNAGMVSFQEEGDGKTRVRLRLDYEPQGSTQHIGNVLGVVGARVQGDLTRFKDFIEQRGRASGGWRGQIRGSKVRKPTEAEEL